MSAVSGSSKKLTSWPQEQLHANNIVEQTPDHPKKFSVASNTATTTGAVFPIVTFQYTVCAYSLQTKFISAIQDLFWPS